MGKLILIILSLSLFLFPVSSHAISEYDGHEWSNWTKSEKTYFLTGFISGSGYVISSFREILLETEEKILAKMLLGVTEREIEKYKRIKRHDILGITVGQLIDGLNSFYSDFRNKRIRCVFRRIRTLIPIHSGHSFQSKADAYSKAKRTPPNRSKATLKNL